MSEKAQLGSLIFILAVCVLMVAAAFYHTVVMGTFQQ